MKHKFSGISICFVLSLSCTQVKNTDYATGHAQDTIVLNNESSTKRAPRLKKYRYIPLETTDECLIAEITKILYKDEKYFVLDRGVSRQLFVFDTSGKFLYKINQNGRGFGEYISPNDFDVDDIGNIYIQDLQSRKIIVYNKNQALKEIKITVPFMEFALSKDENKFFLYKTFHNGNLDFVFNEFNGSRQQFTDRHNEADKVLDDISIPFSSAFTLFHSQETLNFQKRFSPYIYTYYLNNNEFKKRVYIETDLVPSLDFIEKVQSDPSLLMNERTQLFIRDFTSIYETNDLMFLNVYMNTKTIKILINKKTGKVGYYDGLTEGVLTNNVIYGVCEDSFISAFTDFVDQEKFLDRLSSLNMPDMEKEKLKTVSSVSNPVLTLLTFDDNL